MGVWWERCCESLPSSVQAKTSAIDVARAVTSHPKLGTGVVVKGVVATQLEVMAVVATRLDGVAVVATQLVGGVAP